MTKDEKLQALREEWKAKPWKRKIIEYQAKLLGMGKDDRIEQAKEIFPDAEVTQR